MGISIITILIISAMFILLLPLFHLIFIFSIMAMVDRIDELF
jgi:hypothetical protein